MYIVGISRDLKGVLEAGEAYTLSRNRLCDDLTEKAKRLIISATPFDRGFHTSQRTNPSITRINSKMPLFSLSKHDREERDIPSHPGQCKVSNLHTSCTKQVSSRAEWANINGPGSVSLRQISVGSLEAQPLRLLSALSYISLAIMFFPSAFAMAGVLWYVFGCSW